MTFLHALIVVSGQDITSQDTLKKQGQSYEINVQAVLAFREIGKGHSTMTTFCKVLNMPVPPRRDN